MVLSKKPKTQQEITISTKAKKILDKANENIDLMRETTNQLLNLNSVYIENALPRKEGEERDDRRLQYLNPHLFKNKKNPLINRSSPFPDHTKVPIRNFDYINGSYRQKLSQAFGKFNPIAHLENLYLLQELDPKIEK